MFAIKTGFGLSQNSKLSGEEREVCINAFRNNRNNRQNSRQNDSQTTTAAQATLILNNPNPKRMRRRKKVVLIRSNAGSATKQGTLRWNAEKGNP